MTNLVYQFLNKNCPVCDKEVDCYNYVLKDNKRIHFECIESDGGLV